MKNQNEKNGKAKRYNNNREYREYLKLIREMNPTQKKAFDDLLENVKKVKEEAERKNITKRQFTKALFIVDMNNGFVNFGAMHNKEYNSLVPEQLRLIEKFRKEEQLVNFIMEGHLEDAVEFMLYPDHCVDGSEESELIPEFKAEENKENTNIYYKNSINGGLNMDLAVDLEDWQDLKEIVIAGVCTDLCVLDFAKTLARLVEEVNRHIHIFVVASAVSTFDAPGHDRDAETEYAFEVMRKSGIEVVDDFEHLERREKELKLVA